MSLINQMLKDLEERKQQEGNESAELLDDVRITEDNNEELSGEGRKKTILLLLAAALVVGSALFGWKSVSQAPPESAMVTPAGESTTVKVPVPAVITSSPVPLEKTAIEDTVVVEEAALIPKTTAAVASPVSKEKPVSPAPVVAVEAAAPQVVATAVPKVPKKSADPPPQTSRLSAAKTPQKISPVVTADAPPVKPAPAVVPAGPQLQNWQVAEKGPLLSIQFDFDRAPGYRVWRQRGSDDLIVDLQGVHASENLDLNAEHGDFLAAVSQTQIGKNLRLTLQTRGDFRMFYRDFAVPVSEGEGYRLLLELYHAEAVAAPVPPASAAVVVSEDVKHQTPPVQPKTVSQNQARPVKQLGEAFAPGADNLKKDVRQTDQERFRQTVDLAHKAWTSGNVNGAEQVLRQELALHPEAFSVRDELVRLLWQVGRVSEAETLLQQGLAQEPQRLSFRIGLARLLVERGGAAQARILLDTGAAPDIAENRDFYALSAAIDQRLGAFDRAAATYRRLLGQDQNNGTWWVGLGIALESSGHAEDVDRVWQKALQTRLPAEMDRFVRAKLKETEG